MSPREILNIQERPTLSSYSLHLAVFETRHASLLSKRGIPFQCVRFGNICHRRRSTKSKTGERRDGKMEKMEEASGSLPFK